MHFKLFPVAVSLIPFTVLQYPTRKIYMLEGITPSIELTGGPWYTDNDLDTEFIERISLLCHKFVKELVSDVDRFLRFSLLF